MNPAVESQYLILSPDGPPERGGVVETFSIVSKDRGARHASALDILRKRLANGAPLPEQGALREHYPGADPLVTWGSHDELLRKLSA